MVDWSGVGEPVSYRVEVQGQVDRRQADQLLATGAMEPTCVPEELVNVGIPQVTEPAINESSLDASETDEISSLVPDTAKTARPRSSPTKSVEHHPRSKRKTTDRLICKY